MKKIIFIVFIGLVFTLCSMPFALCATLNLRATWTANTETDMASYKLYRTDGERTLIGTIPHPTTTYDFSVTVPDQSAGTLVFVLTAVDTNNNESEDSISANHPYNLDSVPPAGPRDLSVQPQ